MVFGLVKGDNYLESIGSFTGFMRWTRWCRLRCGTIPRARSWFTWEKCRSSKDCWTPTRCFFALCSFRTSCSSTVIPSNPSQTSFSCLSLLSCSPALSLERVLWWKSDWHKICLFQSSWGPTRTPVGCFRRFHPAIIRYARAPSWGTLSPLRKCSLSTTSFSKYFDPSRFWISLYTTFSLFFIHDFKF